MPLKLVSNFTTGFDQELEPWLLMDDAFTEMNDYEIERGVIVPRKGIHGYAQGGRNSKPNEQSRIQNAVTSESLSNADPLSATLANGKIRPGSVTITDSGGQSVTDDGAGAFTGDGTGTINYITGAITVDWTSGPTSVTAAYTYADNTDCMMIANYITNINQRELIVAGTDVFNVYSATNNRFEVLTYAGGSSATTPTGGDYNFFNWTNYPDSDGSKRLVMTNNIDNLYVYDGTNITLFNEATGYQEPALGTLNTGLNVHYFAERLVVVKPTIQSTSHINLIVYTGIRDSGDNGNDFQGTGSGSFFLPTQNAISGSFVLGDFLIVWTTEDAFALSITDDADDPFLPRRIRRSAIHGLQSPYSCVEILGEVRGVGQYGMVATETRNIYRIDKKIPEFTKNRMTGVDDSSSASSSFDYCFGQLMPDLERIWWTYADVEDGGATATRVLVNNYENNTWNVQRTKLSCMGIFQDATEIPWDSVDGDEGHAWAQWDTTTNIWDSFFNQKAVFFSLSGDHKGFIYRHDTQFDKSAPITGITAANPAVITTDVDVFEEDDEVWIDGVTGYTVDGTSIVNDLQFRVTAVSGTSVTISLDGSDAAAYTSGGSIQKVFPRDAKTKPFNPFTDKGQQCSLKSLWFLIDTNSSQLYVDLFDDRRATAYRSNVPIGLTGNFGESDKKWVEVTVNNVANFHSFRIKSYEGPANERIHAYILDCEPTGRLYR